MEYKKINDAKYLLVSNDILVDIATNIMSDISGGNLDLFESSLNDMLFDSILSRLVTSDFFANGYKIPNDMNFINIETSVNERKITFSVGEVHSDNITKKLT